MALTKAQVKANIGAFLPDNTSGAISPEDVRDSTDEIIDNFVSSADSVFQIDTLADLSEFLSANVYSLPANGYLFNNDIDFGSARIELITTGGFYVFQSKNINLLSSSTALNFITNPSATGVLLKTDYIGFIIPNSRPIDLFDGDSYICNLPFFFNCAAGPKIEQFNFVTARDIAMVQCGAGLRMIDVVTTTIKLGQWSAGQDLGGIGFHSSGAAAERFIMNQVDARPEDTEKFLKFDADYGGDFVVTDGIFDPVLTGEFFDTSGKIEDDNAALISGIKNGPATQLQVNAYIAEGDEALTTTPLNDFVVIAGVWTCDIKKGFTCDALGKVVYTRKEPISRHVTASFFIDPDGGNNRTYNVFIRMNGTDVLLRSRGKVTADGANPANLFLTALVDFVENDYFEFVIQNKTNSVDVTIEATSLVVS